MMEEVLGLIAKEQWDLERKWNIDLKMEYAKKQQRRQGQKAQVPLDSAGKPKIQSWGL